MKQQYKLTLVSGLQFKIFAILWAIASLFHMAHSNTFALYLNFALLTLAAVYVIFRPNTASFVVLLLLQLFDAFYRMPFTTNHWIFTAFVNLTILQVLLYIVWTNRSLKVNEDMFFESFAPLVRIEITTLYFFAVFHKLNSSFFNPEYSCATDLLKAQHIDSWMPLSNAFYKWNAYFTIIIESLIPISLWFRYTRTLGVVLGIFFHCVLSYSSYNAFYDFSSMVLALYFLFISPRFSEWLFKQYQRLKGTIQKFALAFSMSKFIAIVAILLAGLVLLYVANKKLNTYQSVHLYFFWTSYSIVFASLFVWFALLHREHEQKKIEVKVWHWTFVMLPIIVFLNGVSPYIGLKTENSYAMFSNLRTEGGITNHFIMLPSLQIFNFQKDIVEIISSTDPRLQELAAARKGMVLFEFTNYVNEKRPEKVEYKVNGKARVYKRSDKVSHTLLPPNPYVLAKLMKFRPFHLYGPQPCMH